LVHPSRAAMYKKNQDISTVGCETTMFSRNIGNLLLSDAASHPRRREAHVFFVSFLCLFLVIFIFIYFLRLSCECSACLDTRAAKLMSSHLRPSIQ